MRDDIHHAARGRRVHRKALGHHYVRKLERPVASRATAPGILEGPHMGDKYFRANVDLLFDQAVQISDHVIPLQRLQRPIVRNRARPLSDTAACGNSFRESALKIRRHGAAIHLHYSVCKRLALLVDFSGATPLATQPTDNRRATFARQVATIEPFKRLKQHLVRWLATARDRHIDHRRGGYRIMRKIYAH